MCNLSEGIEERALERGIAQGIKRGLEEGLERGKKSLIYNMYLKGYTNEQIADISEKTVEEIDAIIEELAKEN